MEQGLILGRYRPLEVRGTGGFSTVEIAFDTRIQRRVAIKRIPLPPDSLGAAPGLEEARTAALLSNPHIVQVFDFECDASEAFIIMEYVDGLSLLELMELEGGFLGLDEAACIVEAVSQALEFAHENQVLHLDIKPDNILIDYTGCVKVADFGMSQLAGAAGFREAEGGTIGYMPPEQMLGEGVDERSDEWAFASTVYEMLIGKNPFAAKTIPKSLKQIEYGDIDCPSAVRHDMGVGIDAVLFDALSPSMDVRFDSIADFSYELLPYLGDAGRGQAILAKLIVPEEDTDGGELLRRRPGLWNRIDRKGRAAIGRAALFISCAWLVLASTYGCGFPLEACWIAAGAVAVVAALVPQLGSILSLVCLGAGLVFQDLLVIGIAVLVCSVVWWLLYGRDTVADAALPFSALLCGAAYIFPLFPLLCGFCLPVKRALPASLFGSLLMLFICGHTGSAGTFSFSVLLPAASNGIQPFIALASTPTTWILLVGWVFAAVLMSALCSKAKRVLSIVGSLAGVICMFAFIVLAQYFSEGAWSLPGAEQLMALSLAFVIACAITALGAPYRARRLFEEE